MLHIVSFDIPYPPNYGGVIDVFYKIKALHNKGTGIILHCFEYPGRNRRSELAQYCSQIYYYPRRLGIKSALSMKPYIVSSRRSKALLKNLLKDDHPILFEGLHSCYYLNHPALKKRLKIYRESNIEHRYYFNLFRVEKNLFSRFYFLMASLKLRLYQKVLKHASLMLVVSEEDTIYLSDHFPDNKVEYLPSFHANNELNPLPGRGTYALYNGNIEVPENAHAVKFLIREVFSKTDIPFKVAGMNPPDSVRELVSKTSRVSLVENPSDKEMFELIRQAHVNILVTFQATGLKLKLLNTLYKGRFCLVNDKMLNGTGLAELCETGNSPPELRAKLMELFSKEFKKEEIDKRQKILRERYANDRNAEKLIEWVFTS